MTPTSVLNAIALSKAINPSVYNTKICPLEYPLRLFISIRMLPCAKASGPGLIQLASCESIETHMPCQTVKLQMCGLGKCNLLSNGHSATSGLTLDVQKIDRMYGNCTVRAIQAARTGAIRCARRRIRPGFEG